MPLSFGIILGILVAIAGIILHIFTTRKIVAKMLFCIGAAWVTLTLIVIMVAVNMM